jgi:2-methylisocitrate lyase-like PEP mutase family enzyme
MDRTTQARKADALRRLHDRSRILVLPNAWDVGSACVFAAAGFPAVATSSAGVAWALGHPDGQHISRAEMADAVRRIARRVAVPVTADMEGGYGDDGASAAETVRAVIAAGAVGLNLEDGTHRPDRPLLELAAQVERVRAARQAADAEGVPVVLNARTDVYLAEVGPESGRFDEAVRRANAYREAGADCLFVPGVRDPATIGALVRAINGPVNILAGPGTPPVAELERLGVARVSVGGGPARAALTLARRVAEELRGPGTYTLFTRDTLSYAEVNRLLARPPE